VTVILQIVDKSETIQRLPLVTLSVKP
jgi:hypothetical protein